MHFLNLIQNMFLENYPTECEIAIARTWCQSGDIFEKMEFRHPRRCPLVTG